MLLAPPGVGALDYMMDQLRDDADLFKNYLDTSPPVGWSDPNWLEIASPTNAPAPDTDPQTGID